MTPCYEPTEFKSAARKPKQHEIEKVETVKCSRSEKYYSLHPITFGLWPKIRPTSCLPVNFIRALIITAYPHYLSFTILHKHLLSNHLHK